jgi:hypothetical protein
MGTCVAGNERAGRNNIPSAVLKAFTCRSRPIGDQYWMPAKDHANCEVSIGSPSSRVLLGASLEVPVKRRPRRWHHDRLELCGTECHGRAQVSNSEIYTQNAERGYLRSLPSEILRADVASEQSGRRSRRICDRSTMTINAGRFPSAK